MIFCARISFLHIHSTSTDSTPGQVFFHDLACWCYFVAQKLFKESPAGFKGASLFQNGPLTQSFHSSLLYTFACPRVTAGYPNCDYQSSTNRTRCISLTWLRPPFYSLTLPRLGLSTNPGVLSSPSLGHTGKKLLPITLQSS